MTLLRPARLRVIRPEFAAEVVSPPYDLLSRKRRRKLAKNRERSFLNATRSPDDFPGMDSADVIEVAKAYLADRLAEDAFDEERSVFFVYRITSGDHSQTGVVGDVSVEQFPGVVRPHELTRVEREDQLVNYLVEVGASSSPVALMYSAREDVDRLVDVVTATDPLVDVVVDDERQEVWGVPAELEPALSAALDLDAAYIIDGHHRVAAARRLTERLGVSADDPAGRFLAVLFPDRDLWVHSYNRWISEPWPGPESLTEGEPPEPSVGTVIAVTADGWVELDLEPHPGEQDATALSRAVLGPRFGVEDERTDERLVFVPGVLGARVMCKRVEKRGGVGFLLHPTDLDEMKAISDRGDVMPPKSTFFAPKPRSGIFLSSRTS